jgi:hypothetical protein
MMKKTNKKMIPLELGGAGDDSRVGAVEGKGDIRVFPGAKARTKRPSDNALWLELIGPLLETEQVQQMLGLSREEVEEATSRKLLLALKNQRGAIRYPAIQFSSSGELLPAISAILEIFDGAVQTPSTVASWLVSPKEYLDGDTPVAWLRGGRNPRVVIAGAEQAAARLAN